MTRIFSLLLLLTLFVSCDKAADSTDCTSSAQAEDGTTSTTNCTVTQPATGEGSTTGSTTGGSTTGGSTTGGSTTGGSSTTGGTSGGTTGSSTGGTSTGGTTGSSTGSTTGSTSGGSLPNEAYTFNTNLQFFNVTAAQESKFLSAVEIIKKVVATEEFRTRILNFTYGGKKTFVDNGGFTNAQIYQKILDAAEELQPSVDNEMDMEVELYYASTSTVGYTYANNKRIWVNSKFFNGYTAAGVAHNLFHEWLHKLGFTHASSYSVSRDSSVPYAIGNLMGEIGEDFL